jgi:2-C-methyl-D-erythritol 4-phosphate cytidylyltransferase/2-C-methyl-D-erythritol 2,4-cyclodiphosphate synthase
MTGNVPPRVAVLIAAAGSGRRVGGARNKVLLPLAGSPVLVRAVRVFQAHPAVERIGVIVREVDREAVELSFPAGSARAKLLPWIVGGARRQESVYNGLAALAQAPPDWVLVHDGARPFCGAPLIDRVLAGLVAAAGAVPVLAVEDTVRRLHGGHSEVVEREGLYRTQTPQGFHWEALWAAHRMARERGLSATDDAQLLEASGATLAFVEGEPTNVKLTTSADLSYGEWLLEREE